MRSILYSRYIVCCICNNREVFIIIDTIVSTTQNCSLFYDINVNQLKKLFSCLAAVVRNYEKDDFIFMYDDKVSYVGIVLFGGVHIIQEDFWGNRTILTHVEPCGMFGESFSCAGIEKLPMSVIAKEKTEIMLIDYRKIVSSCSSACVHHSQLIRNMLRIIAEKNIMLTRKIEHLSKRTTREKLLSFLSENAVRTKSTVVKIPFNRQELADYLCLNRSALSREISLMQKEGLVRYDKNCFELLC